MEGITLDESAPALDCAVTEEVAPADDWTAPPPYIGLRIRGTSWTAEEDGDEDEELPGGDVRGKVADEIGSPLAVLVPRLLSPLLERCPALDTGKARSIARLRSSLQRALVPLGPISRPPCRSLSCRMRRARRRVRQVRYT